MVPLSRAHHHAKRSGSEGDKGVFLDNYITIDIKINCYAIDTCFVEVVYDREQNVITKVRSFKKLINIIVNYFLEQ
jgi:hypothetical protein